MPHSPPQSSLLWEPSAPIPRVPCLSTARLPHRGRMFPASHRCRPSDITGTRDTIGDMATGGRYMSAVIMGDMHTHATMERMDTRGLTTGHMDTGCASARAGAGESGFGSSETDGASQRTLRRRKSANTVSNFRDELITPPRRYINNADLLPTAGSAEIYSDCCSSLRHLK